MSSPPILGVHVAHMFETIDACRWDRLPEFFHDDVEYHRPGYDPICGLPNLLDFYRRRRVIASGRHTVEHLCTDQAGEVLSATGAFSGTDRQGHPVAVRFTDVYRFRSGRIARRETFFYAPAV